MRTDMNVVDDMRSDVTEDSNQHSVTVGGDYSLLIAVPLRLSLSLIRFDIEILTKGFY